MKKIVIGISGKMGSGKNYLATELGKVFTQKGYSISETSFALPLKAEATTIVDAFHTLYKNGDKEQIHNRTLSLSFEMNIPVFHIQTMLNFMEEDFVKFNVGEYDGYTKSEGMRRTLQYLGTEVRRNQNSEYWTDAFLNNLPETDVVFVPDVRFPNEAEAVKKTNGTVIRLEVPHEVIMKRASARDKLRYSAAASNHDSEILMDNYEHFDLYVGETFNAPQLVDKILALTS